jgi:hypothetical protein
MISSSSREQKTLKTCTVPSVHQSGKGNKTFNHLSLKISDFLGIENKVNAREHASKDMTVKF